MMTGLTAAQRDLLDRITPVLGDAFGERVLIARLVRVIADSADALDAEIRGRFG